MTQDVSRTEFLKYAQYSDGLIRLEKRILQYSANNRHTKNFCANNAWYSVFKPEMCKLAGYGAKDERLRSSAAYSAAYEYLYHLLPDCNHNSICWMNRNVELI